MDEPLIRPLVLTWLGAVGLFLASLVSIGVLAPFGSASVLEPASILLVLPLFMAPRLGWLVLVLAPALFVLWSPGLRRGSAVFPLRSLVLLGVAFVLSSIYFVSDWSLALELNGTTHTLTCLAISVLLAGVAAALGWSCRRHPSYGKNLCAHFILFGWLITYAFPYLGEWP